MKKLELELVFKEFENKGCKLLAEEYKNNHTLMPYICSCGNQSKINLKNFKKGKRCKRCGIEKAANNRKHSFEYVKEYFEKNGCLLLSKEYSNANDRLSYICSCGNESMINFGSFKNGTRCKKCGYEKLANDRKHSFEYVKKYFEKNGCLLLSKEYKNNQTLMSYICSCGNESKISFGHFKNGKRCKKCANEKISNDRKHSFEYVKECFEKEGCKLLSKEYKNSCTLMPYICSCGNQSKITFNSLQRGGLCPKCRKSKGEKRVAKHLNKLKLVFNGQKRFQECKDKRMLPFDFIVVYKNKEFLIEYHGEQHYRPVAFNGSQTPNTEEALLKVQKRDKIKADFCKNNNIPLLIIPYWDFNRIEELIDEFINML